jgi:hypothetical protein
VWFFYAQRTIGAIDIETMTSNFFKSGTTLLRVYMGLFIYPLKKSAQASSISLDYPFKLIFHLITRNSLTWNSTHKAAVKGGDQNWGSVDKVLNTCALTTICKLNRFKIEHICSISEHGIE